MTQLLHRCLSITKLLNTEYTWNLTQEQELEYTQKIVLYCKSDDSISDHILQAMLQNYHADHEIVESLRNSDHVEHESYWADWTRRTLRILIKEVNHRGIVDEAVASLEDLVQEALIDLWIGLPKYRYLSRFNTWTYAVVGRCLARHNRSLQAQKRRLVQEPQPLQVVDSIQSVPSLEQTALNGSLWELVNQVLVCQVDPRLNFVFRLWFFEDMTLRSIGEQLHLSSPRVHALLAHALVVLRGEISIQQWLDVDIKTKHCVDDITA